MIHKLLKIENVGTFVKVEFNTPNWNGEFKKYNAIYADNGCGKTTFTQLLKSCKSMRDAQELEKILQMFLNGGTYGGERFLKEESINLFTQTKSDISRRALGFDKPDLCDEEKSPCCPEAPSEVYGHTGYTGTCFWVDKRNNMMFIFLSNRVYPHRWNKALMTMNIRPKIQNIAYEAMKLYEGN